MVPALLKKLCAVPTAPFCEQRMIGAVEHFCRNRGLSVTHDPYDNLLVSSGSENRRPRWVFVAHMDHPGMQALSASRDGEVTAAFRGHVLAKKMRRARVLFFDQDRRIRGRIIEITEDERGAATQVVVKVNGDVPDSAYGMFDLPVAVSIGEKIISRALDDIAGVAAVLKAMVNIAKIPGSPAAVLLTRGEESGFIGAIAAARDAKLVRKSDVIVSVECSAMQPYAPQGKGVVIRVGDKTSVFDSAATWQLTQTAEALAKHKKRFAFQRALMPGGTCEASAFGAYGYRAAAVCLPLGNYHNMAAKGIAAEYIHIDDWHSLVDLLTAIGTQQPATELGDLRAKLDTRFVQHEKLLRGD